MSDCIEFPERRSSRYVVNYYEPEDVFKIEMSLDEIRKILSYMPTGNAEFTEPVGGLGLTAHGFLLGSSLWGWELGADEALLIYSQMHNLTKEQILELL